jgi:hypothetical protein
MQSIESENVFEITAMVSKFQMTNFAINLELLTLMLHPHKISQKIFMGTQREKIMGSEGVFMGSYSHKKSKILWVPIMPGTVRILWVPDFFFIFEHSITFCSYILWVQDDKRRARIVESVGKNVDAGIEPVTSR